MIELVFIKNYCIIFYCKTRNQAIYNIFANTNVLTGDEVLHNVAEKYAKGF